MSLIVWIVLTLTALSRIPPGSGPADRPAESSRRQIANGSNCGWCSSFCVSSGRSRVTTSGWNQPGGQPAGSTTEPIRLSVSGSSMAWWIPRHPNATCWSIHRVQKRHAFT